MSEATDDHILSVVNGKYIRRELCEEKHKEVADVKATLNKWDRRLWGFGILMFFQLLGVIGVLVKLLVFK